MMATRTPFPLLEKHKPAVGSEGQDLTQSLVYYINLIKSISLQVYSSEIGVIIAASS